MAVLLGAIADDFTGATDLANTLVRQGMSTVQLFDAPADALPAPDVDAVVVALKSRTIPAADAIRHSLQALHWLRAAGARQIFFKYCSTFDSTPAGNIGPVADALLAALDADFTIACPAFPETGRTICHGYLFVGEELLSESGMKDHPLTPMRDPSLVRVLAAQTPGEVGLVRYDTVARGPEAIRGAFGDHRAAGRRHAIVDALSDADLMAIGEASADLALVTGGSGVALGLPENFRRRGLLPEIRKVATGVYNRIVIARGGFYREISRINSTANLLRVRYFNFVHLTIFIGVKSGRINHQRPENIDNLDLIGNWLIHRRVLG